MKFDELMLFDEIERLIEGLKRFSKLFQFADEFLMKFAGRFSRFLRRSFFHDSEKATFFILWGSIHALFDPSTHEILNDLGKLFGIVANVVPFADEIAFDDSAFALPKGFRVLDPYRVLVFFSGIFLRQIFPNVPRVDQHVIYPTFSYVAFDDRDEVFHRIPVGFPMLGHDVANVDDFRFGSFKGFPHPRAKQVGDDARIQVAWADDHVIGIEDRFSGSGIDFAFPNEERLGNCEVRVVFGNVDVGFADNLVTVLKNDPQMDVVERDGNDLSPDVEHFAKLFDSGFEIPGNVGESGEQEVSNSVPAHPVPALEAVLEELPDGFRIFGKREYRPANVAGR